MANIKELLEKIGLGYSPVWVESVSEKRVLCSGPYDAEDVVSESTTVGTCWEFANVVKKKGGAGIIHDAVVLAETTAIASWLSLFLHKATPTCALNDDATNTAFLLADRDIAVTQIDFPACSDVGTGMSCSIATPSTVGNLPKAFVCNSNSTSLYGVVAIRNALDLADNTILRIALLIEQL